MDINPKSDDADAKLNDLLEHFAERLSMIFAYHFFRIEFQGDEDLEDNPAENSRTWALQTIHNACLDTCLVSLRDIDDFFTPDTPKRRSKPDDIRASQFGFAENASFLTATERENINKIIAHLTTVGVRDILHKWDILELVSKCVAQATQFFQWVELHYRLSDYPLVFTSSMGTRTHSNSILKYIRSEAAKVRQAQNRKP